MQSYNYNLYNPKNSLFFNLSYLNSASVFDSYHMTYSVSLTNLYDFYFQKASSIYHKRDFSLLPLAVRYYNFIDDIYVIERPPFEIEVDYSSASSYRSRKNLSYLRDTKMWVPWTLSIIKLDKKNGNYSFNLYFNDGPINSFDEAVIPSYLPNCNSHANVCMGEDSKYISEKIMSKNFNLTDIYNEMFNQYFIGWNKDLQPRFYITDYYISLLKNKISQYKNCPKSLKLDNHYTRFHLPYNNSQYLAAILYSFSKMNFQETMQYVSSAKDSLLKDAARYSSYTPAHSLKDHINSFLNSYNRDRQNTDFNDYYYHNNFLFEITSTEFTLHSSYKVCLENVHLSDFDVIDVIDNPYLISIIYNDFIDKYHQFYHSESKDSYLYSHGNSYMDDNVNLTLNYSDISSYNKRTTSYEKI
jgi:hypothetical protein